MYELIVIKVYQDADRIDHIYESITFIKIEAVDIYSMLLKSFYQKVSIEEIDAEKDLTDLMDYLNKSFDEDDYTEAEKKADTKNALRLVELIYDLFVGLTGVNKLTMESKSIILNQCKETIKTFKAYNIDVTAVLVKILALIAIKERDCNVNEGMPIIQVIFF